VKFGWKTFGEFYIMPTSHNAINQQRSRGNKKNKILRVQLNFTEIYHVMKSRLLVLSRVSMPWLHYVKHFQNDLADVLSFIFLCRP